MSLLAKNRDRIEKSLLKFNFKIHYFRSNDINGSIGLKGTNGAKKLDKGYLYTTLIVAIEMSAIKNIF